MEPSSNEGPSQPSLTPTQTGGQAQSGAWGQFGVGGRGGAGAQAPGGGQLQLGGLGEGGGQAQVGAQSQAQTQPWMQPRAGLRSSVLVQGGQQSWQQGQVQPAQGGLRGPVGAEQQQGGLKGSNDAFQGQQGGLRGQQGQTQARGFSTSMPGALSSQGSVQLGGLRSSQGGQGEGIPGPPPTKRINTGMSYTRA